jgi:hypothetical protein
VLKYNPEQLTAWAQTLFVTEMIYGLLIALEKTSILLLYRRLFSVHRWFRMSTTILIAYAWMWAVSEALTAIFQCQPVALQWDKTLQGTCIDQLAFFRWISVPNVIHDVAMLLLPIPIIWKLQINIRQKIALSSVFLIGSMCAFLCFRSFFYFL